MVKDLNIRPETIKLLEKNIGRTLDDINHSKILYGPSPPPAAAAKSLQSCPTLYDPIDGSSPGSPIPGILQARTLEWVAFSFSSHTLLEHYIPSCPSCQLPWVPGAARTPATQAAAPPPHLALTGANPSHLGQPQVLNPSGRPTCRSGNKNTIETQGRCD